MGGGAGLGFALATGLDFSARGFGASAA